MDFQPLTGAHILAESFNAYLDESCHLEHDDSQVMTLGCVWCPEDKTQAISVRLREIKVLHGLASRFETKWIKVSPAKVAFYQAVLDFFLDDDDLHFRGVVIPDKSALDHGRFQQSHDDWYYKMCFTLLEPIIDPTQCYSIYLDIKDTRSEKKRAHLEKTLRTAKYDGPGSTVRRVQQIRSHESELMQLADLLIGAVTYANRGLETNSAKLALIQRLRERTGYTLTHTTWMREPKLSLLRWESK